MTVSSAVPAFLAVSDISATIVVAIGFGRVRAARVYTLIYLLLRIVQLNVLLCLLQELL